MVYDYSICHSFFQKKNRYHKTSTYTYDALNRLTAIGYPTTSLNVAYTYDQADATTVVLSEGFSAKEGGSDQA